MGSADDVNTSGLDTEGDLEIYGQCEQGLEQNVFRPAEKEFILEMWIVYDDKDDVESGKHNNELAG